MVIENFTANLKYANLNFDKRFDINYYGRKMSKSVKKFQEYFIHVSYVQSPGTPTGSTIGWLLHCAITSVLLMALSIEKVIGLCRLCRIPGRPNSK